MTLGQVIILACTSEEFMLDILRELAVLVDRMENMPDAVADDMEEADGSKVSLWQNILKAIIDDAEESDTVDTLDLNPIPSEELGLEK